MREENIKTTIRTLWDKNHLGNVLKSLLLAILWTVIASVVGLLQLWLFILSSLFVKNLNIDFTSMILNGIFLFSAMALVSAVAVDYFFSRTVQYSKWITGVLFVLFPLILFGFSALLFALCHTKDVPSLELQNVTSGQYAILIMSLIYAILMKTLEFVNSYNKS